MEPGSSCPVKAAGGGKQSVQKRTAALANANEASRSVAAVEKAQLQPGGIFTLKEENSFSYFRRLFLWHWLSSAHCCAPWPTTGECRVANNNLSLTSRTVRPVTFNFILNVHPLYEPFSDDI